MKSALVIGGGLAGQRFVESLRREGFEGSVTIVSDEPLAPYDRPPLSKETLSGEGALDTSFRPEDWYADNSVELVLDDAASSLDPESRTVTLASGATISADGILLATGSRARDIPAFSNFSNSQVLRGAADAAQLRDALVPGARLGIVGAGFIGLEVASTARKLGVDVSVAEAAPIPLRGLLGDQLGGWLTDWHSTEGVDIHCGTGVETISGGDLAEEIVLADGTRVPIDHLLVAVGSAPNTDWLEGSGLDIEDGVRCDRSGRTEADGIWAAGDMARPWNARTGAHRRAEHWEAAAAQGRAAARDVMGLEPRDEPMPSFWSDMYGVRLQHFGHPSGADRIDFDGDPDSLDFEAVWYREDEPVAAMAVGRPRSVPALRKMFSQPHPETATPTK